ncbi:MAG TPA: hypothetical protein VKM69_09320 [Natronoarchaeum rubrum]|nr:hypothetical protein [Natronoarchaeum rubrum]
MSCPFLEYRRESDDLQFEDARAYCGAAERFVQPMRADICNDRYDLDHADHCEIYREHADAAEDGGDAGDADAGDAEAGDGDADDAESNDAEAPCASSPDSHARRDPDRAAGSEVSDR